MNHDLETIARIAQARKTVKILAESELPTTSDGNTINRLLACAGWAPFHKVCHTEHRQGELNGIEPWRFHCLDAQQCRKLGHQVTQMEAAGKIPAMLAAASHLIIATWLPNPANSASKAESSTLAHEVFEPTIDNVEHIAAASAAIQTLLLAATAAGISNYWSSGGVLRTPELFSKLGIPDNQRLLGAIFLFPAEVPDDCSVEIATSKLRAQRSSSSAGWSRVVKLPT